MTVPAHANQGSAQDAETDYVCECFEAAWRSGAALSIEEVLRQANPTLDRTLLVDELIATEIELRRDAGGDPSSDEYTSRFPDHRSGILRLFQNDVPADGLSIFRPEAATLPVHEVPGFDLLDEIGRGGMAVVYKAYDTSLNRLVALKLIDPDRCPSSFNHRQLQREAKSIAQLRHPGIVQIYGIGEHQGQPYLILELVPGRGLDDWLNGEPQPPGWSAALVAQTARAVDHAHRQGVIHRDLKPGNILLTAPDATAQRTESHAVPFGPEDDAVGTRPPVPVVADFGLAKQLFSPDTISGHGALFGTPSYMPPEQSEGRSFEATPASDVYSMGAVLYELLTGRPPFVGASALETLHLISSDQPVPPRRRESQIPLGLEAVCLQCLEKDPRRRYSTASALADALQDCIVRSGLSPLRNGESNYPGKFRNALAAGFSLVSTWLGNSSAPESSTRRAA